jgi:hypothetical protein
MSIFEFLGELVAGLWEVLSAIIDGSRNRNDRRKPKRLSEKYVMR